MCNLKSVFLLLCLGISLQGVAVAQADLKIGAISVLRILDQAPQAATAKNKLADEFAPREQELLAVQKELNSLEEQLTKDKAILSDQQRIKLERNIVAKRRDFQNRQQAFQDDFNFRRNEEFAKIQEQVIKVVNQIAADQSYDAIFSEGLIYAGPKIDISQLVIDKLKQLGEP